MQTKKNKIKQLIIEKYIINAESNSILPSENELAKEFNVHRNTVRQALQDMHFAGLVDAKHGVGWFTKNSEFEQKALSKLHFNGSVTKNYSYKILENTLKEAGYVSDVFFCVKQRKLGYFRRVQVDNKTGRKLRYEETYYNLSIIGKFENATLRGSLFQYLGKYAIPVHLTNSKIFCCSATKEVANILEVPEGIPLLCSLETTKLHDGTVVFYSMDFHLSSQVEINYNHIN